MDRRSLLIGASCIAAVGVAELLRPRTVAALKGKHKLADIIPRRFVGWTSTDSSDIVIPKVPDSLADRLYSDMVGRIYSPVDDDKVQPKIMLLAAYGAAQTDMLQLHRPESCYPAIGFTITHRRLVNIPLSRKVMLPAVELTAVSGDRVEDIVYWTRLGEYLPQTSGAQRRDRLKTAMAGLVSDGMLVRCSATRVDEQPSFKSLYRFVAEMVNVVNPIDRKALVGTGLNNRLGSSLNVAV